MTLAYPRRRSHLRVAPSGYQIVVLDQEAEQNAREQDVSDVLPPEFIAQRQAEYHEAH